jgi:hypothetical protein
MADIDSKNKDTVDGFDFDGMDWGSDNDGSSTASSGSSSSSASLGDDDPFNSAEDDGFGGNDSFYSLEQMPDADSSDAFSDIGGDDFGDIKTDDEPVSYDFGSDADDLPQGQKITDSAPSYDSAEDPFDTVSYDAPSGQDDDDAVDPFAVPDETDGNAGDEEAPAERPKSSKFKTYLMAAAAVVVVVGGAAYTLPSVLGVGGPVEVAQVQPSAEKPADFPLTLPSNGSASPEITPPKIAQADPAPVSQPAAETPSITIPQLGSPAAQPQATDTNSAVALPSAPSVVLPGTPDLPKAGLDVAAAPAPSENDPYKGMIGGAERGGIDAIKSQPAKTDAPAAAPKSDLAVLSARLDALEGKFDRLSDKFDNFVDATIEEPAKGGSSVVSAPAQSGDIVPPMKPPIVEGVSLKGVAGEVAWISTKSGVVEVKVGDDVPNGGKVVSFRNYRGDWIVVTTIGLIVR